MWSPDPGQTLLMDDGRDKVLKPADPDKVWVRGSRPDQLPYAHEAILAYEEPEKTFVVLCIVVVSKFTEGAWVPTVVIPLIVLGFTAIKRHYTDFDRTLRATPSSEIPVIHHTVVIPIGRITPAVLQAVGYGRAMKPDRLVAVKVVNDHEAHQAALEVIASPYRDLAGPIIEFIDRLDLTRDDDLITVLIPEFVVRHWWDQPLHNQSALALKARLLFRPNTAVTSLPVHLGR